MPEEVEARSPALDRHHLDEPAQEVLPFQLVLQVEVLGVVVVLQAALQQLHHRVLLHPAVDLEHLDCKNARHSIEHFCGFSTWNRLRLHTCVF